MSTENIGILRCYLDDYLVAADCLEDNGFSVQADVFREMHDRVVGMFCCPHSVKYVLDRPYVIDGHMIATDRLILIRMRCSKPDTDPHEMEGISRTLESLRDYVSEWDRTGDGDWESFPVMDLSPISDDEQRWEACPQLIAERSIQRQLYERIMALPEPEYLFDIDKYIGDHANQPLRFRFRCGEGVVMPVKQEQK